MNDPRDPRGTTSKRGKLGISKYRVVPAAVSLSLFVCVCVRACECVVMTVIFCTFIGFQKDRKGSPYSKLIPLRIGGGLA